MQESSTLIEIRPRIASMANLSPCSREDLIIFFERLFANCDDVMNLFALRDGTVLAQNEASFRRTGYTREEFISRPIESFYPPEELPKVAASFAKMAESGFTSQHVKMYYKNGELRDLWVRSYVIQREPEPICLVHTIDVTEEKQQQEKAIHEAKLASLGEFATALAHELGNTVQAVEHGTLFLQQHTEGMPPLVVDSLAKIKNLSEHMTRVLRNMQRFASFQKDTPKHHVSVSLALRSAIDMVQPFLKRHRVATQVEIPRSLPPIHGISSQLQQIFVILFRNAVQAMMDRSVRKLHVTLKSVGDRAVVSIRDTGGGIPADVRARLFEAFATTKREGNGLGLGLAIAKRLANDNGASIDFETQEGEGTVFHVSFPVAASRIAGSTDESYTVLIMDDDPIALNDAVVELSSAGFVVLTATSASEAAEILRYHQVAAVLAEIDAYPVSGVAFAKEARALHSGPFILIGDFDQGAKVVTADVGAAVLPKPMNSKELLSLLRQRPRHPLAAPATAHLDK